MFAAKITPSLEMDKLAVRLGGNKEGCLSPLTKRKVRHFEKKLPNLIRPRLTYRIQSIERDARGYIWIGENLRLKSRKVAKTLEKCRELVCFVTTIGRGIEGEIQRLFQKNRLSEAYILDAMGSVSVENIADQFQKRVESEFKKVGKATTLRFSPGYCDWPITEQKKLFRILTPREIGIHLTDSCLMHPRKSISGVFGISSNGSRRYNPCVDCRKGECEARRI